MSSRQEMCSYLEFVHICYWRSSLFLWTLHFYSSETSLSHWDGDEGHWNVSRQQTVTSVPRHDRPSFTFYPARASTGRGGFNTAARSVERNNNKKNKKISCQVHFSPLGSVILRQMILPLNWLFTHQRRNMSHICINPSHTCAHMAGLVSTWMRSGEKAEPRYWTKRTRAGLTRTSPRLAAHKSTIYQSDCCNVLTNSYIKGR